MNDIRYEQVRSNQKKGELSISKKAAPEDFIKNNIVLETVGINNYLLFKITDHVNWRLSPEYKIPLSICIHIHIWELRFYLFSMSLSAAESRDEKLSQCFPSIKKICRPTLD